MKLHLLWLPQHLRWWSFHAASSGIVKQTARGCNWLWLNISAYTLQKTPSRQDRQWNDVVHLTLGELLCSKQLCLQVNPPAILYLKELLRIIRLGACSKSWGRPHNQCTWFSGPPHHSVKSNAINCYSRQGKLWYFLAACKFMKRQLGNHVVLVLHCLSLEGFVFWIWFRVAWVNDCRAFQHGWNKICVLHAAISQSWRSSRMMGYQSSSAISQAQSEEGAGYIGSKRLLTAIKATMCQISPNQWHLIRHQYWLVPGENALHMLLVSADNCHWLCVGQTYIEKFYWYWQSEVANRWS